MARKLIQYEAVINDLDGTDLPSDAKSTEFAWDAGNGLRLFRIDISDVQSKEMQEFLQPFMDAASKSEKLTSVLRPRGKPGPASLPRSATRDGDLPPDVSQKRALPNDPQSETARKLRDRAARLAIKEWANGNGWNLGNNGRTPRDAILAYYEANPNGYIPESTLQDALAHVGDYA